MSGSYDFSELNALVIDDSTFMVTLMRALLEGLNFNNVYSTRKLDSVLDSIRVNFIDVVFTDWEMGTFSGEGVVGLIRRSKDPLVAHMPVIAISAYTDVYSIKGMLRSGVDDVLVKPIAARTIYERLSMLIEKPPGYVSGPDYLGPKRNVEKFLDD